MKAEKNNYGDKVVAFIDILGFEEIVNSSIREDNSTSQKGLSLILDTMKIFHTTWDNSFGEGKNKDVTLFSDSAIISFDLKAPSEVFYTLIELLHLTLELLRIGVLIRGGISVGKCIHNQSMVFGPGVNRAVRMEKLRIIQE